MQFNDTTNIDEGIIQGHEFWTRLGDGEISGNATLLKQFTGLTNRAFDRIMPRLLSLTDTVRFDDPNHTKKPIGTVDITSGDSSFKITADEESVEILNFVAVRILQSATATEYITLPRKRIDEEGGVEALSLNSTETGIPTSWIEQGNRIVMDKKFNYSATDGVKLIFERAPSRFADTDTTKEPGIPVIFHELLVLYPALDWITVYRTKEVGLKNDIKEKIAQEEHDLDVMIAKRHPVKRTIVPNVESNK